MTHQHMWLAVLPVAGSVAAGGTKASSDSTEYLRALLLANLRSTYNHRNGLCR